MAGRTISLRLDEKVFLDIKRVAAAFDMTLSDVIREALSQYLPQKKEDPDYKTTANATLASDEE